MNKRNPVTETISASQIRQQWSQVINRVFRGEARIVVEKSGLPVAAIISAEDLARLARYDEARARSFEILERGWRAFADVPDEELEAEAEKAVQAARQETQNSAA